MKSCDITAMHWCVLLIKGIKSDADQKGVIPNSFDQIFSHIARTENQQYLVRASFLEIYMVCCVLEWFIASMLRQIFGASCMVVKLVHCFDSNPGISLCLVIAVMLIRPRPGSALSATF